MRRNFFDRKADRYVFAKFTCLQCGVRQSQPVAVGKKSARCIDCSAPHHLKSHELSSKP